MNVNMTDAAPMPPFEKLLRGLLTVMWHDVDPLIGCEHDCFWLQTDEPLPGAARAKLEEIGWVWNEDVKDSWSLFVP